MSTQIPKEVVIWKFGGKAGNLKSQDKYATNTGYHLFCSANNQYLTYGKEPFGINIVWATGHTDKKVHFRLPGNKEREIPTGEPFALGLRGGDAFLYYTHRSTGINLGWSSAPVFQWRLCGIDGKKGVPVKEDAFYAIVNDKVLPDPDFLIYLDRVPGQADIGWTTSPNWAGKIMANITKYEGAAKFIAGLLAAI